MACVSYRLVDQQGIRDLFITLSMSIKHNRTNIRNKTKDAIIKHPFSKWPVDLLQGLHFSVLHELVSGSADAGGLP